MWSLLLVGCVGIAVVSGYSRGPPAGACRSMQPGPDHQPNKEKKNPPFNLVADVQDNGQVKVFLRSKKEGQKFRGFMIMAEVLDEREDHRHLDTTQQDEWRCHLSGHCCR